jgi:hypothetical protein
MPPNCQQYRLPASQQAQYRQCPHNADVSLRVYAVLPYHKWLSQPIGDLPGLDLRYGSPFTTVPYNSSKAVTLVTWQDFQTGLKSFMQEVEFICDQECDNPDV